MSEETGQDVDGTPGLLIQSSRGGSYFIPHSDLSKYRLADEAAAVVPDSLKGEAEHVSPNVTKVTAHEVPLVRHTENAAAGFPMPESDAAASFPMPEAAASTAAFPMPESDAAASFPMPESDAAASFPAPENAGATFPAPEAHGAAFPMPEAD